MQQLKHWPECSSVCPRCFVWTSRAPERGWADMANEAHGFESGPIATEANLGPAPARDVDGSRMWRSDAYLMLKTSGNHLGHFTCARKEARAAASLVPYSRAPSLSVPSELPLCCLLLQPPSPQTSTDFRGRLFAAPEVDSRWASSTGAPSGGDWLRAHGVHG